MWQKERSADAAGRLENLKELVRSMEEFENLAGFLEHISLVMERDSAENEQAVNIMTLHSAKGLEFDTVILPGWEEGLFPHQRSLDESGRAGLEEERRLAHVGLTRARKRAKIYFATNRRIHGLWTSTVPSRFLDELPAEHVEVTEAAGGGFGMSGYGPSRFDEMGAFGSNYGTPGWRRAQGQQGRGGFSTKTASRAMCRTACSTTSIRTPDDDADSDHLSPGERSRRFTSPLRGRSAAAGRPGWGSMREKQARAPHHRRRADRQIHRRAGSVRRRRARVSPEIRQRQRGGGGRQQAHHSLRQGGRKARGG